MELIAAVDENWALGKDGRQPVYLKEDLKRFKSLTLGRAVILGRKTLATFPGGQPLIGRDNFILSTNPTFSPEGARVFRCLEELLQVAPENSVVIGGASVYQALLPHCSIAYVTKIHASFPADVWLTNLDSAPEWSLVQESTPVEQNGLFYHYTTYARRDI